MIKWITYLTVFCVVYDVIILNYRIHQKADVFTPGLYLIVLLTIVIYTAFIVRFIDRGDLLEKRLMFSLAALSPALLYLTFHLVVIFTYVISWVK